MKKDKCKDCKCIRMDELARTTSHQYAQLGDWDDKPDPEKIRPPTAPALEHEAHAIRAALEAFRKLADLLCSECPCEGGCACKASVKIEGVEIVQVRHVLERIILTSDAEEERFVWVRRSYVDVDVVGSVKCACGD